MSCYIQIDQYRLCPRSHDIVRHMQIDDSIGACAKCCTEHKHLSIRSPGRCPSCQEQDRIRASTRLRYADPYSAHFPNLFHGEHPDPDYDFCDVDPWVEAEPIPVMTIESQLLLNEALEVRRRRTPEVEVHDEDGYLGFLAWIASMEEDNRSSTQVLEIAVEA